MYIKSKNRIISDNDLVTARVVIVNEKDDDDDEDIEVYPELQFSHGYTNELDNDIPAIIKNNLDEITDRYSTVNLKIEDNDMKLFEIPNITLGNRLQISIVDVMHFDFKWNLSEEEKISICQLLKNRGNYKAGRTLWSDAFKNYHKAVKYLKDSVCVINETHSQHQTARELLISCLNNAAISCLKLDSGYTLCVKYCDQVLSFDKENTKALYRKAKALLILENCDAALESIEKCLLFEKDEKAKIEIIDMKSKCLAKLKRQKMEDKILCKDIFNKLEEIAKKEPNDNKSTIPYDIEGWDNSMADKMISITEELEAFGEEMPPRVSINKRNGETCTIVEEEDDFE